MSRRACGPDACVLQCVECVKVEIAFVLARLSPRCLCVCCSVLQCVAACCSMLQCVAVCCDLLHCVSVPYSGIVNV